MDEKVVVFIEDKTKPFYDLVEVANRWIRFNKEKDSTFVHLRSVFDVQPNEVNDQVFDRVLKVFYECNNDLVDPSKCKHTTTTDEIISSPTCSSLGLKNIVCTKCGALVNRTTIDKLPHIYGEWEVTQQPTCSVFGEKIRKCKNCNHSELEKIDKTEHDYGEETVTEPTCSSEGLIEKVCKNCGNIDASVIEKLDHNMEDFWTIDKESTCSSAGMKSKKCTVCGEVKTEEIPMKEHTYVNWEVIREPTYDEGGLERSECSICGNIIEREIPKLPFDIVIKPDSINDLLIGRNETLFLTANVGSLKWSISDGSLPEGSSLNENGVLELFSDENGTYEFTVKASYPGHEDELYGIKTYTLNVIGNKYTITFNAGVGNCETESIQLYEGSLIGDLPIATHESLIFGGWFTAPIDGLKVDESYTVTTDITLYARYGESTSDINFGDAVTSFNIAYKDDRTNYNDQPYKFYHRYTNGNTSNLKIQTGISSDDRSNNMSDTNKEVKLYMKVTNMGDAGKFDIGFDCDSYVVDHGNDHLQITRLENGVQLSDAFSVTVPYKTSIWIGKYSIREENRYNDVAVGTSIGTGSRDGSDAVDTGYALTMNDIFINSNSYAILEVTFKIPD